MLQGEFGNLSDYSGREKQQNQSDQPLEHIDIPPDHNLAAGQDSAGQGSTNQKPAPRTGRKRGRPSYTPNDSARRGIIRWLVESPRSTKKIEEAVVENGGPGRLWLRNFFEDITKAGKGTDLPLKDTRSRAHERDSGREDDSSGENEPVTTRYATESQPSHVLDASHASGQHPRRQSSEFARDEQFRTRRTPTIRWKEPARTFSLTEDNFGYDTVLQASKPLLSSKETTTGDTDRNIDAPFSVYEGHRCAPTEGEGSSKSASGQQEPPKAAQQPSALVQLLSQPKKALRRGTGADGRKPKRHATTFTLGGAATYLDGGRKSGFHQRLAKKYTITRRLSQMSVQSLEKLNTASSEFDPYHRPTYMVPPTPSTYPLATNLITKPGQTPPPSQAVVLRILSTAWAADRGDRTVRDELQDQLPRTTDEREAFVTTTDHLGVTPLHVAVAYGWPHTCRLLLEHGADPDALTAQGTSIYDFAEPAARRYGADMCLYFRILHCRKFIALGKKPPAPNPKTTTDQQAPPQEQHAAKEPQPRAQPLRAPLHLQTAWFPGQRRDESHTTNANLSTLPEPAPWCTTDYTISPTPSDVHRHNSLHFSSEQEPYERQSERRTTVAPYLSSSSHYSEPSFTMSEATGQPSSSLDASAFGDTVPHLQNTYGTAAAFPRQGDNPPYSQGDRIEKSNMWSTVPQHPNFPNPRHQSGGLVATQAPPLQHSALSESLPTGTLRPPAPSRYSLNIAQRLNIPEASTQPMSNMMPLPTQFQPGRFPPPLQQHGVLTNMMGQRAFHLPGSNMLGQYAARHNYWYHQMPPTLPNPSIPPQTTNRNTLYPPVSAPVPVSAHYSDNTALFEAPPWIVAPPGNNQTPLDDSWFCIVGDPACGLQHICPHCRREYNLV